jgi:hypothetical protein
MPENGRPSATSSFAATMIREGNGVKIFKETVNVAAEVRGCLRQDQGKTTIYRLLKTSPYRCQSMNCALENYRTCALDRSSQPEKPYYSHSRRFRMLPFPPSRRTSLRSRFCSASSNGIQHSAHPETAAGSEHGWDRPSLENDGTRRRVIQTACPKPSSRQPAEPDEFVTRSVSLHPWGLQLALVVRQHRTSGAVGRRLFVFAICLGRNACCPDDEKNAERMRMVDLGSVTDHESSLMPSG